MLCIAASRHITTETRTSMLPIVAQSRFCNGKLRGIAPVNILLADGRAENREETIVMHESCELARFTKHRHPRHFDDDFTTLFSPLLELPSLKLFTCPPHTALLCI